MDGTLEWEPEKLFLINVLNRADGMKPPNNESKNYIAFLLISFSTGKLKKKVLWTNIKYVFFVNC